MGQRSTLSKVQFENWCTKIIFDKLVILTKWIRLFILQTIYYQRCLYSIFLHSKYSPISESAVPCMLTSRVFGIIIIINKIQNSHCTSFQINTDNKYLIHNNRFTVTFITDYLLYHFTVFWHDRYLTLAFWPRDFSIWSVVSRSPVLAASPTPSRALSFSSVCCGCPTVGQR